MTDERSLRLLEFSRVREDVAGYCLSEEGREAMLGDSPHLGATEVATLKAKVSALIGIFQEGRDTPTPTFPDIAEPAKAIAKSGASLEIGELYAIGLWAESYAAFVRFMKAVEERGPSLGLGEAPRPRSRVAQWFSASSTRTGPSATCPSCAMRGRG